MKPDKELRYKVTWTKKWCRQRKRHEGEPTTLGAALAEAESLESRAKVVTILKLDTGEFCADNAGKWFLYLIIK